MRFDKTPFSQAKSQSIDRTQRNSSHSQVSAGLRHLDRRWCRIFRSCRPIRQRSIDINLLRSVDIDDANVGAIPGLRAVEKTLIESAAIVVVASALHVLLANTNNRQRLFLVRVRVRVIVVVLIGISVRSIGKSTSCETQCSCGQNVRCQTSGRPRTCSVGRSGTSRVVRSTAIRGSSS